MACLMFLLIALLFIISGVNSQNTYDESSSDTNGMAKTNEVDYIDMMDFVKKCLSLQITEEACIQMINAYLDDPLMKRTQFASWGGKRDNSVAGDKGIGFSSWGGKRNQGFSSWGGKRNQGFSSWGGKRGQGFSSWGGKRTDDLLLNLYQDPNENDKWNEIKRAQDPRETSNEEVNKIQANKKEMVRTMKAFSSWGGKRSPPSGIPPAIKPLFYLSRCGEYTWPNRWSGKRTVGFSSWGGKRSNWNNENEKDRFKREFINEEINNSQIQISPIANVTLFAKENAEANLQNKDQMDDLTNEKMIKETSERTKKWMARPLRWAQDWYEWSGKRAASIGNDVKDIVRFSAWGGKRREKTPEGKDEKSQQLRTSRFYAWGGKRNGKY